MTTLADFSNMKWKVALAIRQRELREYLVESIAEETRLLVGVDHHSTSVFEEVKADLA